MIKSDDTFKRKFLHLLVLQASGSSSIASTDPYTNWHSPGQVFGRKEYPDRLEKQWSDSKVVTSFTNTNEKEDA